MRNPIKAIREAWALADALLSLHEVSFAELVSEAAKDEMLRLSFGLGLTAAYGLPIWARPYYRRKLCQMHTVALTRLTIRRDVIGKGMQEIALAAWPKEIETK